MIIEYINDSKFVLVTRINNHENILVAVMPSEFIYIPEKYCNHVNKSLKKNNEYTLPPSNTEKELYMTQLVARITEVITNFIQNEEQFTILDVSNAVKQDGNEFVKHMEVRDLAKPILKVLIETGLPYEAREIDVNTKNGVEKAVLYTPFHIKTEEYVKTNQIAIKPPVVYSAPAAAPATPKVQKSNSNVPKFVANADDYVVVKVRKDGAIEIPTSLFAVAGLDLVSDVDIINHPNSISIVEGTQKVMRSGLRISATCLNASNISNVSQVYVAAFKDKIVISK